MAYFIVQLAVHKTLNSKSPLTPLMLFTKGVKPLTLTMLRHLRKELYDAHCGKTTSQYSNFILARNLRMSQFKYPWKCIIFDLAPEGKKCISSPAVVTLGCPGLSVTDPVTLLLLTQAAYCCAYCAPSDVWRSWSPPGKGSRWRIECPGILYWRLFEVILALNRRAATPKMFTIGSEPVSDSNK